MLAIWRVHGVDRALRRAWEAGVVMTGLSAGSLCWFEAGTTDSFGRGLAALSRRARVPARAATPRTTTARPNRRPRYHQLVAEGALPAGYAADDGAALVFDGRTGRGRRVAARCARRTASSAARTVGRSRPCCRRATWAEAGASAPVAASHVGDGRGRRRGLRSRACRRRAVSTVIAPAGRHEPRREVGQRREDEQAASRRRVRDLEQPRRLGRVGLGVDRAGVGRTFDGEPCPTEDQQVEVELARAPAPPPPPAELALEILERREQRERSRSPGPRRPATSSATTALRNSGWSVTPTGVGGVQPRDAAQTRARERGERGTASASVASASPTFAPRPM